MSSPSPVVVGAAESAQRTCDCAAFTTGCGQCEAGRCCSNWGFCGNSTGYCTPCYCKGADGNKICDPCHCVGRCPAPKENQQQQQQQLPPSSAGSGTNNQNGTYNA
ncbi:unnamed protein product [Linum trigynum]